VHLSGGSGGSGWLRGALARAASLGKNITCAAAEGGKS